MDRFDHRDDRLFCEAVPVADLAERFDTPLYVYSAGTVRDHFRRILDAFADVSPLVCYSVKANSNLAILKILHDEGAGFDIVSGGELFRVQAVGGDPARIVFAGVGKTDEEIAEGVDFGLLAFNVESEEELLRIEAAGRARDRAVAVAIRLNPDVDPHTHRYITTGKRENKFGLDLERARATAEVASGLDHVKLAGVHMHIGSQILEVRPYGASLEKVLAFADELKSRGHPVETVNVGGGFGITYDEQEALPPAVFAETIVPLVAASDYRLILEPGRFIVGNAGILLTRVVTAKRSGGKRFAIVDAGMNDLVRPSLYSAFHRIWPVAGPAPDGVGEDRLADTDVVGPICESSDFLGKGRLLPPLKSGDLLAVFSAGAYGFTMASNYNSRPRPAEVLVDGDEARLVRQRETREDLVRGESF
ncbi:MAG: diaminopimelate decarboxylase [Planctomycetota bacterium]|jgi:diaminopimelate decarboxylase